MELRESLGRLITRLTSAWLCLVLIGCGGFTTTSGLQMIPHPGLGDPIKLTYLGTGGWVIEAGTEMLITAPLFSNPGPFTVLVGVLDVDETLIDQQARVFNLDRTLAVLVGHGHYDHLMDVPYLVEKHASTATIYGSRTVQYQLAAYPGINPGQVVPLNSLAGDINQPGQWTSVGNRFRFMPIRSRHSPHTSTIHLWQGVRTVPMTTVPKTAHDFLEGEIYAFLIDVLDAQGGVQMRIYYNDSASTEPIGFPAPALKAPDPIPTVAVLTAPGHKFEQRYPDEILSHLGVDYALVGHWEYFLGKWGRWEGGTPTTDVKGFVGDMERLMAGKFWVPTIGTEFVFNRP